DGAKVEGAAVLELLRQVASELARLFLATLLGRRVALAGRHDTRGDTGSGGDWERERPEKGRQEPGRVRADREPLARRAREDRSVLAGAEALSEVVQEVSGAREPVERLVGGEGELLCRLLGAARRLLGRPGGALGALARSLGRGQVRLDAVRLLRHRRSARDDELDHRLLEGVAH